jgi:CRP-like cAMP-binding protein
MAHELLNGLSETEAERVLALGTRMTIPGGGSLFRLGDEAKSLFLIERGRVRLTFPMMVRDREEDVLFEEKLPGETVGWSAFVPPYLFTLSGKALEESEVIALPREALFAFCEATPEVGFKIATNLAVLVGKRLQLVQTMWMREFERIVELKAAKLSEVR